MDWLESLLIWIAAGAVAIIAALFLIRRVLIPISARVMARKIGFLLPPADLTPVEIEEPQWRNPRKAKRLIQDVISQGFQPIMHTTIPRMNGVTSAEFIHESGLTAASVVEQPVVGCWIQMHVHFADGAYGVAMHKSRRAFNHDAPGRQVGWASVDSAAAIREALPSHPAGLPPVGWSRDAYLERVTGYVRNEVAAALKAVTPEQAEVMARMGGQDLDDATWAVIEQGDREGAGETRRRQLWPEIAARLGSQAAEPAPDHLILHDWMDDEAIVQALLPHSESGVDRLRELLSYTSVEEPVMRARQLVDLAGLEPALEFLILDDSDAEHPAYAVYRTSRAPS